MMRKTYINPKMSIVLMQHETALATSGVGSNNGIGYGGVDTDGSMEPDVKENLFDFEWE